MGSSKFIMSSKFIDYETNLCAEMYKNMVSFHNKSSNAIDWFFHETPCSEFESIRKLGLKPSGKHKMCCPKQFKKIFGSDAINILCMRPHGAKLQTTSSGWPPFINLAISGCHLPNRISLDWSYEWKNLFYRWNNSLSISYANFTYNNVINLGSLAIYDSILPEHLLIRVMDSTDDPKTWPSIE